MSPLTDDRRAIGRITRSTVWKTIIVLNAVGVVIAIGSSLGLFNFNSDAIDANTELNCRIGAFFVGVPVVRQPKQSPHDFHHEVSKAESFLTALKQHDCTNVKGARITTAEIDRSLKQLRKVAPPRRAAGSSSGSPQVSPQASRPSLGDASALPTSSTQVASVVTPSSNSTGGPPISGAGGNPGEGGGRSHPPPSPPPTPPRPKPPPTLGGGVRHIVHGVTRPACQATTRLGAPLCIPAP